MKIIPVDINLNDNILSKEALNGRVNIVDIPEDVRFQMYEKIAVKNKTTEYRDPLVGIMENNILSEVYFSKENIQIVQNGLRAGVYELSAQKYNVPPQNMDTLKIIMRSIYLQYAEHQSDNITGQVERLNRLVLEYVVPNVYNEADGYIKYCRDQSTLVTPMDHPMQTDRDFKQLELKPWV
jgi:hypothetical protein